MQVPKPTYGISRIDQPSRRSHGWFVRISSKGVLFSKFFSDKSHGGKAAALVLARKHRDALFKRMPKERIEAAFRRRKKIKKSGTTGVTHVLVTSDAGKRYEYWQAAWRDEAGRRRTTKYSVLIHGNDGALALARKHLKPPAEKAPKKAAPAKKPARSRSQ